jgi:hypothetical protein
VDAAERAITPPRRRSPPTALMGLLWALTFLSLPGNRPPGNRWQPMATVPCPACGVRSTQFADYSGRCDRDGPFRQYPCVYCDKLLTSWNGTEWECSNGHLLGALPCPGCQAIGMIGSGDYVCIGPDKHAFFLQNQIQPCEICDGVASVFLSDSPTVTCATCGDTRPRNRS